MTNGVFFPIPRGVSAITSHDGFMYEKIWVLRVNFESWENRDLAIKKWQMEEQRLNEI